MPRLRIEPRNSDLQGQMLLPLAYKGMATCQHFRHSENLFGRHIWSIINLAQQNEPQETEAPLYNGLFVCLVGINVRLELRSTVAQSLGLIPKNNYTMAEKL